ncbi:TPA: hypothetical protein ACTVMT_004621, partial [Escherichia coli]
LSATQHGNKPPLRHKAKSLKRHIDYIVQKHLLTRNIHSFRKLRLKSGALMPAVPCHPASSP